MISSLTGIARRMFARPADPARIPAPARRRGRNRIGTLAVIGLLIAIGAAGPAARGQQPSATGVVEGQVTYQSDPKRPWRYARYYIRDRRAGQLAEAVVALRGRSLRQPPAEAATTVIDQKNFQFVPETVAINTGDSVKFTNSDAGTHNVRSNSPLADFNANMPQGGEFTYRFERAGGTRQPVQIGCVYHGAMRAWVFVFDHPFHALTGADGRFRLEGVPLGEHRLEMRHAAGELVWRGTVAVQAGRTTQVEIRVSPDNKP